MPSEVESVSRRAAGRQIALAGIASLVAATSLKAVPQPHMENALRALRNAKNQLETAEPDKAGHRVKAIELVNQAIAQVEEGIKAGN